MTNTTKIHELMRPEDIVPGDPTTTLWRLCIANKWAFVPDCSGGEPFINVECAAYLLGVAKKTLQTDYMDGVPKYGNGLVRLSEVMRERTNREKKRTRLVKHDGREPMAVAD